MQRHLSTPDLLNTSLAHYRVLGRLGRGGMGEVFVAEDQRLRRRVALKVLPPELAAEPRHLERFKREAWSIAALNHPNIVTIYSVEEAEGLHFLVLELIEGETLADLLATGAGGPMPLERVLEIALALAEALEAAHARNVIHRDLKPRNIMVSREGRIKVLDFGIARVARSADETPSETSLTRTGGAIGTASYMSPEQIQERPVDPRSDLFSLGIVLYEMATGQHPFRRKSQLATLAAILCETPPPPSALAPELPDRFDEIVNLCLAKDPFLRYRGAAELRRDLQALESETETTLASPAARAIASLSNEPESSSSTAHRETHPRLPARPRCFGRETEVRELVEAICSNPPPPVPVLGPAGAGKTTITLATLHDRQVASLFGKRRWFIRCDGATGRDSLVGAIARVICPDAIPPLEPKIILNLEEAPAVLALDNLETPWERDTAAVEDLLTELAAIPGLALTVSLRGEQRPIGPSWREAIHARPLDPESARQAFLAIAGERYREDPELDSLLTILDGMALAVVLLASQAEGEPDLSMLSLRWQDRRTALLQRADTRERHHSLEASLDLSIDSPRMTDESRRLLSILGLLPEGIARDDMEFLLPGQGVEAASVLRKVGLAFDQGSRLRNLAPIREYLQKSHPPRNEDLDRTVQHFLTLAQLGEKIGTDSGAEVIRRLRLELGNLEPMILIGLGYSDPGPALRAAIAYAYIVRFTGMGSLAVIEQARSTARQSGLLQLEADCTRSQGDIYLYRSGFSNAQSLYEHAMEIYEHVGDLLGMAHCIAALAEAYLFRTAIAEADLHFKEAYSCFHAAGDPAGEAQCLLGLGASALFRSDLGIANDYLQASKALYQQIGDLRGEANCLMRIAQVDLGYHDFEGAEFCYEKALSLFREAGSLTGEALCISNLGNLRLQGGDTGSARALLERGLSLNRQVGSLLGEANCLRFLGDAEVALSNPDRASAYFEEARLCFRRLGQAVGEAHCYEGLADCALSKSDFTAAREWFEHALSLFLLVPDQVSIGRIHLHLAPLFPFGSPERLFHIEAARQAWKSAGIFDQRYSEIEAIAQSSA